MSVDLETESNTPEATRAWIREHHVTWEISPLKELVDHVPLAVGFEVRLYARVEGGFTDPGSRLAVALHAKLRAIAMSVLPNDDRPSTYTIEPFEASLHLRPEAHWDAEVELAIHVIHRHDYLQGVDDCETRCATEIQNGLRNLGVQQKTWHDGQGA